MIENFILAARNELHWHVDAENFFKKLMGSRSFLNHIDFLEKKMDEKNCPVKNQKTS